MNISLRGALVVASAAALAALTGCGSSDTAASPASSSSAPAGSTTTTVSAPATASSSAPAPAPASGSRPATASAAADGPPSPAPLVLARLACGPVPDRYLTAVTGAFKDRATTLINAFVVPGPNELQYIGAAIVVGGKAAGATGVWVAKGENVYALSDEARSRTSLSDGSAVGASAGDEFGRKAESCVSAGLPELGLGTKGR